MTLKRRAFRLTLKRPRDLRAPVYSGPHATRKVTAVFLARIAGAKFYTGARSYG